MIQLNQQLNKLMPIKFILVKVIVQKQKVIDDVTSRMVFLITTSYSQDYGFHILTNIEGKNQ